MTTDVVAATSETTLKEVANLLVEHGISGVPVCDDGTVVGVVSESDIIWKEVRPLSDKDGFVSRLLDCAYGDDKRAKARTAGEAMSSPAITVEPDVPVARAARMMLEHMINRVPVVRDGHLVGVLTRGDLVRVFRRTDAEIDHEIRDDILRPLCVEPGALSIGVVDGDVCVSGEVENHSTALALQKWISRLPGVTGVTADIRWKVDDRSHRLAAAASRIPRKV
jgi:CBS domain-containing protein